MDSHTFFNNLEYQYSNKLPFVVYSRPVNNSIKCWFQKEDTLYKTKSFLESGFVFAPFDLEQATIIFPEEHSVFFEIELEPNRYEFEINDKVENPIDKYNHINLVSKGIESIKKVI